MEIIQLKGVTKEFGGKIILDNANFSIEEGDIYGIIGQSGVGKSTLLNLIIGFYQPDEGKILFQFDENKKPKEIHKNLTEVKKNFGFAAQISSFYPKLTIKENLTHFGKLYGIKNSVLKTNISSILEFTELKNHQNELSEHISVGMQKRLDLSCSLIHKPKVLLLDEPTANLDPVLQQEIIYLIKQANQQGITIIIASHQLDIIEKICNKVSLIHNGKVTTHEMIEKMKSSCLQKEGAIHLKAGENHQKMIDRIKQLPASRLIDKGDSLVLYSPEIQNALYQIMNITQQEKITLEEIDIKKPSLQEVFETIVKEEANYPY